MTSTSSASGFPKPAAWKKAAVLAASLVLFGGSAAFAAYIADDAVRRRELQELSVAMERFARQHGGSYVLPAGAGGIGIGFVETRYDGNAPRIVDYLAGLGYLNSVTLGITSRVSGHMLYVCDGGKRYTFWTKLKWVGASETKRASSGCNAHGANGTMDVYGMNYAVGN